MGGWHFIPWTLQYLVGGVLSLLVALTVFKRNPKALSSKYFLAFGICLIVWMLLVFVARNAPSLNFSIASYRIIGFAFIVTYPLLLLMILYIKFESPKYFLAIIPALFLSCYISITAPFEVSWTSFGWAYSFKPYILPIGMSIIMSYPAAIIGTLIVSILKSRVSYLRRKYGLILIGFLLYFIPFTINNVIMWANPNIPPFGGILLTIEFLFIACAVSIKPEKIEVPVGKPLEKLTDDWLKFLQRLREVTPRRELGEDTSIFQGAVKSIGLSEVIKHEHGKPIFDVKQLANLDMTEAINHTTDFMRKQDWALEAREEYTDIFTDLYKAMHEHDQKTANSWLNTVLHKYGGFLDKQGVLAAMPSGTRLPSIFKELQSGNAYLFKEEKPIRAYEKLKETLEYGFEGFCFTKLEPQKVRAMFGVEKASLVWLTFKARKTEQIVNPKNLAGLSSIISTEVIKNSSKAVVLLDCLDQIVFANSFKEAAGLIKKAKELCQENGATFLLSIDPDMFETEQVAAIEKEMQEVGA